MRLVTRCSFPERCLGPRSELLQRLANMRKANDPHLLTGSVRQLAQVRVDDVMVPANASRQGTAVAIPMCYLGAVSMLSG